MIQTIYNIHRAMELEPDPMRRLSMMAILRDTLKRMEQIEDMVEQIAEQKTA